MNEPMLGKEASPLGKSRPSCMLCPCPQLTAYWTPPPNACRRICCCEGGKVGGLFGTGIFRELKSTCIFLGVILLSYYFIMDIFLFMRFAKTDIVKDSLPGQPGEMYSPFTHLGVKSMMNDHTSQYIISPTAEYFDYYTGFSQVFYFITPNMISFTHLFTGFVSGKFIASENLQDRRIGVILFQFRTWLDAFDGVVFRSQSNTRLQFRSVRNTMGYYVDTWCDAIGGAFLSFGVMFYLFKRFDSFSSKDLPVWNKEKEASSAGAVRETHTVRYVFWKVLCYGAALAAAGKLWDITVGEFKDVLQVELKDPVAAAAQFELTHSTTVLFLFYMWRLLEGQAMLQYFLIPIWLDKVWEFLNYTQYILLGIILSLWLASVLYVRHLRSTLGL